MSTDLVVSQQYESEALATVPPQALSDDFFMEPEKVLERAEKVAKALKSFLDRKEKPVTFNGKRYPQAEDWQFVGAFFGHTACVRSTTELRNDEGDVCGYVAVAHVLNKAGLVVSAAEAACMIDEQNWARKPCFQLRSMAQTRACAKALRNVFAWVMIMAGLAPTPAEEMTGEEEPQFQQPKRKSEQPKPETPKAKTGTISEAQRKRLWAISKSAGVSEDLLREIVGKAGFEHGKDITRDKYEAICTAVEDAGKLIHA